MYYIFCEKDKLIGAGEAPIISKDFKNIKVDKQTYELYTQNPQMYIYINNELKLNPQYETIKQKEYIKKQIEEIVEKLAVLDNKRIRAVCEDEVKNEKTGETWLDFYNAQIYDLRIELNSLESQL